MSKYQKNAIYNKLVRDKIPDLIQEKENLEVISKKLSGKEQILELKKKMVEEASELLRTDNIEDIIVELGDIREAEAALLKILKLDTDTVEKVRLERKVKRGGFDQGIYLIETKEKK